MSRCQITVGIVITLAIIGFSGNYALCGADYHAKESLPKKVQIEQRARINQVKGAPNVISRFPKTSPANISPYLQWSKYEGAVAYELEVYSKGKLLLSDAYIYINGYNLKLPDSFKGDSFTWRVRALNLDREPISHYSKAETVYIDRSKSVALRPLPTNTFNKGNGQALLYPVFNWIPINGIKNYQVEILKGLPKNDTDNAESDILLGVGEATGFDWYSDKKYFSDDVMYWRVRGMTPDGKPVGKFSTPQPFVVAPHRHYWFATYGDSITHGGGSLSYSSSDWEYSYQSYLNYETINLAYSSDTSESSVKRFEEDVLPFHPKFLLIMTGSNSLRGEVSSISVIRDLQTLKQKCLDNNICPVFITLPPINPENIKKAFDQDSNENWKLKFRLVNNYIRRQTHIDLGTKINLNEILPTHLAADGLHLDIAGKRLMAEAINEQLPQILQQHKEYWNEKI